ncbi:hypothetical protein H257_09004 [Aphanomyces astaci]|uniref:Uncharacterized protein n=4 Tax=Aphanomyces astaci TaxID=112090 RepID=W4GDU3_APHAT|nr:hypothetical protein H257_09004 [Aphanomyces astaci]ETV77108.1 hypothetical protein H257_09004 [Aphanomyces astaci]|eukprot:XP_009833414.1 hypothetical protein H257_09004 [Aphanomyces astaci]
MAAVPLPVLAELQKLRDEVARLRQEKGQGDSLVHLLQEQNSRSSEEIFDLHAQIVAVEAEAAYKCEQNELSMQHQLKRLVSHTTFLQEEKKSAERARQVLETQLKQLQTTAQLEHKRLEAGKRLLETSKRKLEAEKVHMSQQLFSQATPPPSSSSKRPRVDAAAAASRVSTSEKCFQTDPFTPLAVENSDLIGKLLQMSSDLTMLLQPQTPHSTPVTSNLDISDDLSQLMPQFSQWQPQMSSNVPPYHYHSEHFDSSSHLSKAAAAVHLTKAVAAMLAGTVSAVAMVAPLLQYLQPPIDATAVVCSALRVLYALLQCSPRLHHLFQRPPPPANQRSFSRIVGQSPATTSALHSLRHRSTLCNDVPEELSKNVLFTLGRLVPLVTANPWTLQSMRIQTELFGVLSYLVGLYSQDTNNNSAALEHKSSKPTHPPLIDPPTHHGTAFHSVISPTCDLITTFLSDHQASTTSSNTSSTTDEGTMVDMSEKVVVQAVGVLCHVIAIPDCLPLVLPHLGKWWSLLFPLHSSNTLNQSSQSYWTVHVAVLELMQAITTLYPSHAWYMDHPEAVDGLWDFVKRRCKAAGFTALSLGSVQSSTRKDDVVKLALKMLAMEAVVSKRSVVGDGWFNQHLVADVIQQLQPTGDDKLVLRLLVPWMRVLPPK